jgi:hypothetical protein
VTRGLERGELRRRSGDATCAEKGNFKTPIAHLELQVGMGPTIALPTIVSTDLRGHQAAIGRDGRLLLTLGEAASRLDTGPLGIERLVNEGLLAPADSDGLGRVWFDPADLDEVASRAAARRRDSELPPAETTMEGELVEPGGAENDGGEAPRSVS